MNENEGFDDELMQAACALESEVTPERDLWPEIESSITTPSQPRWHKVFAQAAAVVLLVGASSGLTWLATSGGTSSGAPAGDLPDLAFERASFGGHYMLGPDYLDAHDNLRSQLEEELERLSPQARAVVKKNLDAIREAIGEINSALAREPDNALLQELLLSTYREELSLMMKVDGVANAVMYRTDI